MRHRFEFIPSASWPVRCHPAPSLLPSNGLRSIRRSCSKTGGGSMRTSCRPTSRHWSTSLMEPRIVAVQVVGPFQLSLEFTDGSSGAVDLTSLIAGRAGVFAALQDQAFFSRVGVDREAGTI